MITKTSRDLKNGGAAKRILFIQDSGLGLCIAVSDAIEFQDQNPACRLAGP